MRCHRRIASEEEYPSVTEASIPSTVDRVAVRVLADALGVGIVLS